MAEKSLIFTVPSGITKAALSFVNYDPTGSVTMVFDDFEVFEIDGPYEVADTGWIDMNLLNGWSYYTSGNYAKPQYRRIGDDIHVKAMITGGTITSGTDICQMPSNWGPPERLILMGSVTGGSFCRWDIYETGLIEAQSGWASAWVSFGYTVYRRKNN